MKTALFTGLCTSIGLMNPVRLMQKLGKLQTEQ